MARDQALVSCPNGEWTEITNANATNITFQVRRGVALIRGATTGTPPSVALNGARYTSGEGTQNTPLSDLFAGAGIVRVFARPGDGRALDIYVDHA